MSSYPGTDTTPRPAICIPVIKQTRARIANRRRPAKRSTPFIVSWNWREPRVCGPSRFIVISAEAISRSARTGWSRCLKTSAIGRRARRLELHNRYGVLEDQSSVSVSAGAQGAQGSSILGCLAASFASRFASFLAAFNLALSLRSNA